MFRALYCLTLLYLSLVGNAQSTATPFPPSAVPLAVVHPYFSSWLMNGNLSLSANWPQFSTQGYITGWTGYIRVDGQAYRFLGFHSLGELVANQRSLTWTATQSTFQFTAGTVTLIAQFLTPIEPTNLTNQSKPFSYLAVSVKSDQQHSVQIYSDITAEWISGNTGLGAVWTTDTTSTLYTIHEVALQKPENFSETGDRAHYYQSYYATKQSSSATYKTGSAASVRGQFIQDGKLDNQQDRTFRSIGDNYPAFAHAVDLGQVNDTTSDPVVFVVGLAAQSDAGCVQYVQADSSLQDRYDYYLSEMNTLDALQDFIADYPNAKARADAFDQQLSNAAKQVSDQYAALVALATRQTFGSIQITVSRNSSGIFNQSDVLTFMKEISSGGFINTVDVIYSSMPLFLYTNPDILTSLLEPTLRFMESGLFRNRYVPRNLGKYPVASGANSQTLDQPVEESANMLIMALAAARLSGNGNQLNNHLKTLQGAADYLAGNALVPNSQSSADGFLGNQANTSNLALKGIIGLNAMQEIQTALNITGNTTYGDAAKNFINQWTQLAIVNESSPHMLSEYGNQASFALAYNLYADQILETTLVPNLVHTVTQNYIMNANFSGPYGVSLDSRQSTNTKSDWMMFTAGAFNNVDKDVSTKLAGLVYNYAMVTNASAPFPDSYNIHTAVEAQRFVARPVQGAMFSLLALTKPPKPITIQPISSSSGSPQSSSRSPHHLSKAVIGGAVVGGIVGALFLTISALFIARRWRKRNNLEVDPMPEYRLVTPYATPAVLSGTQLNQRPQELLAGLDDGQLVEPSESSMKLETLVANTSEEMSEPRQSEDGGLTDLVREQLEEEEFHTENRETHERLVQRVVHLISARLGTQIEDVPPPYASLG